jgi:CRP-like cAMP-binding protein
MEFQDQSFVYTSDHNNSPELHRELYEKGVISRIRYGELCNFPWDSKVIYHESGVPPLHTPIKYMTSLPEDIQKRIVIYHIAKKDFPDDTILKLAQFGMENTLYFETEAPPYEEASRILSVFKRLDFMQDMPIWKAQEFLDIAEIKRYSKGERIIEKGSEGNEFHIIYSGNISVDSGGLENNKIYGAYDYFGEVALITDQKRAAHVYAATDVILISIEKNKFLNFIIGTEFEKILKKVAEIRSSETWNLLSINPMLRSCTSTQKTWLESIFNKCGIVDPGIFLMEGEPLKSIYLIRDGEVDVRRWNILIGKLGKGDFIGEPDRLYLNLESQYTYINNTPLSLYEIKGEELKYFLDKNPGLIVKFRYDFMVKR